MEKDKSRAINHLKNKKKFNKQHTSNKKSSFQATAPSKPKHLDSNWDRYETGETSEHVLNSSTDFARLASAPISQGSHFRFKSDASELERSAAPPDLFKLDLGLLNLSLSSQPFILRNGLQDVKYFNENQIKTMENDAREDREKYRQFLTSFAKTRKVPIFSDDSDETESEVNIDQGQDEVDVVDSKSVILQQEPQLQKATRAKPEEDLESWLDDVLDD